MIDEDTLTVSVNHTTRIPTHGVLEPGATAEIAAKLARELEATGAVEVLRSAPKTKAAAAAPKETPDA